MAKLKLRSKFSQQSVVLVSISKTADHNHNIRSEIFEPFYKELTNIQVKINAYHSFHISIHKTFKTIIIS